MIIKNGKKTLDIIKCGKTVTKIIKQGYVLYQKTSTPSTTPYLYTDKTIVWVNPSDLLNIYSNTQWVINKEEESKYLNVSKDTCWLIPNIDTFDIESNTQWICN